MINSSTSSHTTVHTVQYTAVRQELVTCAYQSVRILEYAFSPFLRLSDAEGILSTFPISQASSPTFWK
jgi:hypothetical protein